MTQERTSFISKLGKPMKIVDYYARPTTYTTGGVNRSRQEWLSAFGSVGNEVSLMNANRGYRQRIIDDNNLQFAEMSHFGRRRETMVPLGMRGKIEMYDLAYLHEGWTASNAVAARAMKRSQVPYIVMPHGVYEESIVRTLRPIPGRARVEQWILENALAVHVFFESEVDHVRKIAPRSRFLVAPTSLTPRDATWRGGGDYLAWAGRFDIRHKGIDLMLEGLARCPAPRRPRIRMVGPDYFGDKQRVINQVQSMELEPWVSVEPALDADALDEFMAQAEGFVHVPRWECLGRTVVDALMMGSPLLIARSAHIAGPIEQAGAGMVCDPTASGIAEGLERMWSGEGTAFVDSGKEWSLRYFGRDASLDLWKNQLKDLIAGSVSG